MASTSIEYILKLKDRFSKTIGKGKDGVDGLGKSVGGLSSKLKKIGGLIAGAFAGFAIIEVARSVALLGVEMEQTRVSFATFLGSAEKGNKLIAKLNQFANVTPFDNAQIIQAGKGLLATGIEADKITTKLQTLGDISAGSGKDLNELVSLFNKVKAGGLIQGEELNQLADAGILTFKDWAKVLGVQETQIKKLGEQGKISFADMETAFANITGEGGRFFDLMAKQSQTVGGRFSTLVGQLQMLGITIGESLLPVMGGFVDLISAIVGNLDILGIAIGGIVSIVGIMNAGLIASSIGWGILGAAVKTYTAIQWLLTAAMAANPIGLVLVALVALGTAFAIAWKKSETFRGVILGLWASIKTVFTNIISIAKELPGKIIASLETIPKAISNVFSGVGELFGAILSGDFSSIPEILKKLGGAIIESNPITNVMKTIAGEASKIGQGAGAAYKKGFANEVFSGTSPMGANNKFGPLLSNQNQAGGPGGPGGMPKGDLNAGISDIKSAAPKNFTINIDKLIENLQFNTTNLSESTSKIRDEVVKVIFQAVNDVNTIAT